MINISILLGTATPFKTHSDQLCQYKYTNTLLTNCIANAASKVLCIR